MSRVGRPTAFDPQKAQRLLQFLRAGDYLQNAAASAGIHRDTLHSWLTRGARTGPKVIDPDLVELREFSDAVARARAESATHALLRIHKAGELDWKADAWRLERIDPNRYAVQLRVRVEQEIEGFLNHLKLNLPEEVYAQVIDQSVAYGGGETSDRTSNIATRASLASTNGVDPED